MNPSVEFPWGTYKLQLKLPATSVQLTGLSETQLISLQNNYSHFITKKKIASSRDNIECSVYRLKRMPLLSACELTQDGQYTPRQIRQDYVLHLTGINFKARISQHQEFSQASLGVVNESELAKTSVIENFLRIYVAHHTLQQRGLVLHSAGLVFDGQAYIFSGHSNAGKTTLTRKAYKHGARVLSDDINLLLPSKEGYRAHAVPFTGEFGRTLDHSGGQDAYPVAGIILLEQGEKLMTQTVTISDAVATLLTGCPFVNTDAEESSRLFDAVINLVAELPVIRLISRRQDDVGDIMAAVIKQLKRAEN